MGSFSNKRGIVVVLATTAKTKKVLGARELGYECYLFNLQEYPPQITTGQFTVVVQYMCVSSPYVPFIAQELEKAQEVIERQQQVCGHTVFLASTRMGRMCSKRPGPPPTLQRHQKFFFFPASMGGVVG